MSAIDVIIPQSGSRLWQKILVERLGAAGHDVGVAHYPANGEWPLAMEVAVRVERRLFRRRDPGLVSRTDIPEAPKSRAAGLRIDLSGAAGPSHIPTLKLAFDGVFSDMAVVDALAQGRLPDIEAVLDGQIIAHALPMVDKRESMALGVEDILARAITLVLSLANGDGDLAPEAGGARRWIPGTRRMPGFVSSYALSALPRLGKEALRRARYRHAHWRVGYRFTDGPGVAETAELGNGWREVPDDGDHFYADPFPFERNGQPFIFVEDYPHATGKAIISVVEFDGEGVPQKPKPALEKAFHLSYPQIFERDGEIWMLPEASASGRLTLYRADRFPDRWAPEAELLTGEISDATLLEHEGSLWLFATDRDGYGSTSDTLALYQAPHLAGPWTPHPRNPILIDRRMARPGGAFTRVGRKIFLPVQDGTEGYGGGLGLSELLELNADRVRLSPPVAISATGDWPYPKIHTLNRAGRLEVIDGIAAIRKN